MSLPRCSSCGATTCSAGFVRLWDGNTYCVQCIKAASPDLLDHVRNHDVLEETFRYPALKLAGVWALFLAIGWSSIWLIFPLVTILGGKIDLLESIRAWALISGFGLPIILVFSLAHAGGYALHRPTVSVDAGEVTVTQRGKSETVPLSQCEWYLGKISDMDLLQNTVILKKPALIVVLPPAEGREAREVAVGVNDGTRAIWQAFLTLAKAPQRTAWQHKRRVPAFLKYAALFLAIPVGFVAFLFIGRLVSKALSLVIADQDFCQLMGGLVLIYGCLSSALYGAIAGPWHATQAVPTKRTVNEQFKLRLVTFIEFIVVNSVIAVPIVLDAKRSLASRVVGATLSYVWAASIGYDFGRRLSKYDREATKPAKSDVQAIMWKCAVSLWNRSERRVY